MHDVWVLVFLDPPRWWGPMPAEDICHMLEDFEIIR